MLLKRECIRCRRTGCGVIENTPSGTMCFYRMDKLLSESFKLLGSICRVIDARRTVQAKIKQAIPSPRFGRNTRGRRIGSHAAYLKLSQENVSRCCEPALMTRLADHVLIEARPQSAEERTRRLFIENQTGRELEQQWAELAAEAGGFCKKCIEGCFRAHQPCV